MPIDKIVKLIEEHEEMACTINTEHESYKGSIEEERFKAHQKEIMELKKVFLKYTTMQTALRQVRDTAMISGSKFNAIENIARIALTA